LEEEGLVNGAILWTLRRAAVLTYEEGCLGIAKGAAYSALLSFFPVLTAIAALLVQFRAQSVSNVLSRFFELAVPPGTREIVLTRFAIGGERPAEIIVAASLVSIWAFSGLMQSFMEGFDAVYHVPVSRSFLRQQALGAGLAFVIALPAIGAAALILSGSRIETVVIAWLAGGSRLTEGVLFTGRVTRIFITLAAVAVVHILLYRIGPSRVMTWRGVWPGAIVSTLLSLASTWLFRWYVENLAQYNVFYGGTAAVIALSVWMYLLAVIVLYGCAFNAVRESLAAR
jgi:membrane protein